MREKSPTSILPLTLLVSAFLLASMMSFGLAQTPTSFTISGYIQDSNGLGISGAYIIFNAPSTVPSVISDPSGYYVVSAPAGTYHVNVWPPFDSNFIHHDEQGFVVGSDIVKNITLAVGYKVSGYLSDSSGTPIIGAAVLLRDATKTYGSGWFSNTTGYYFLNVPAGTYTIDAHPRTAYGYNYPGQTTEFPTYYEHNFVVSSNIIKNITVTTPPPKTNLTKISGYVTDANGKGLAGAEIIFGVPDIVPSVYTDNSGHYTIYAPVGTFHINVWPPFDSNCLSFDQPGFTVGTSDISKNITLNSGYKLSGYLTDSSGSPIRGALVSLDQFHCGWYSKSTGKYFVTAPVGTYKVIIQPKKGPTFLTLTIENFDLTGDTVRNFTLQTSTTTPTPSSTPTPTPTTTSTPTLTLISEPTKAIILQVKNLPTEPKETTLPIGEEQTSSLEPTDADGLEKKASTQTNGPFSPIFIAVAILIAIALSAAFIGPLYLIRHKS